MGLRVWGVGVEGLGFEVSCLRCRFWGLGLGAWGSGLGVCSNVFPESRKPRAETLKHKPHKRIWKIFLTIMKLACVGFRFRVWSLGLGLLRGSRLRFVFQGLGGSGFRV